jgi:hypothetical protein
LAHATLLEEDESPRKRGKGMAIIVGEAPFLLADLLNC